MKATLKKHKKVIVIVGVILILLCSIAMLTYNTAINMMNIIHSSMNSTMSTFENKYIRSIKLNSLTQELDAEQIKTSQYLFKTTYNQTKNVQTILDLYQNENLNCYFIDVSNEVSSAKGAPPLKLSDDQLSKLISEGSFTDNIDSTINYYNCIKLDEGLLITNYTKSMELGTNSDFTGISNRYDYFAAPVSDRIIIDASDKKLVGSSIPDKLEKINIDVEKNAKTQNDYYNYGLAKLNGDSVYCLTYETDGYICGLYYKYIDIIADIVNQMIVPFIVLVGTFLVVLIFFFILWKKPDEKDNKWIRIFKTKNWFKESQIRNLSCFVLFALILSLLFSIHYFEFSMYSMQNVLSTENLDMLSDNIEASQKDKDVTVKIIGNYTKSVTDSLSDLFVVNPNLTTHDSLLNLAENCSINEISLYNKEGVQEASSGEYSGYELTNNTNDPMYEVRKILTDDLDNVFVNYDDETGRFVFASKRKDSPGIIMVKYENPKLTNMLSYYSKDEAVKDTDFGNATTFYVKLQDKSSVYVIEPYTSQIVSKNMSIPENLEQDKYSGIAQIDGITSYINSRNSAGISVISAFDCTILFDEILFCLIVVLVSFILLMILLFYGCICKVEMDENAEEVNSLLYANKNDNEKESLFANICFRKMLKYEFIVLIIGYCFMMLKQTAGGQTLLQFVFDGRWEKGVNLFSINASIIVAVLTAVAIFLIKKIFLFMGKSIGYKCMTISSIIVSVLSFIAFFFVILYTLYQFGVNTTALLASAGIAGLVIGIAAKGIFEDLIAGLFLIFEGNIKVGDFVTVHDFRGEVSEIGARVTVIQRYNKKLIVNNSDLKKFYRLSDELGSAWVEIDVGPNEDINKIAELIKSSSEWYQSRIPTLKDGPWFLNVSHFDSSKITICLCGACTEERSGSTRRKLLRNTIELFRENGISLGMDSMKVEVDERKS